MYVVVLKRKAEKQYKMLALKDRKRVLSALQHLRENPWTGKKLEGDLLGKWSLRVWPYRIIYVVEKEKITVTVLAIGHRQGVYKK